MTEILHSPPQLSSSSNSIQHIPPTDNDGLHQQVQLNHETFIKSPTSHPVTVYRRENTEVEEESGGVCGIGRERKRREREEGDQLSLLAVLVTVFRKSLVACRSEGFEEFSSAMDIGLPTNVRHVAHVTFDRFNGFLGLPIEFEPEVPRRPPSASTSVFGVSTESMQLSFDSRGNSVPTILLMMQRRLYTHGGLQAEGIFRINPENGQEEYVREQLNLGVVPHDIDVHCLSGLIKAWFRELPNGVLDSLPPEQVMQAQSEEECARLVRLLPPTEAALLDWAINLMTDVAQMEYLNKMNARNIAMVFAPNMTQMDDPLTALMYAVQVMNFLKTLIVKTLKDRQDSMVEPGPTPHLEPSDDNGNPSTLQSLADESNKVNEEDRDFISKEPFLLLTSIENIIPYEKGQLLDNCPGEVLSEVDTMKSGFEGGSSFGSGRIRRTKIAQSSNSNLRKGSRKTNERPVVRVAGHVEKSKETSIVGRFNSRTERVEAWR